MWPGSETVQSASVIISLPDAGKAEEVKRIIMQYLPSKNNKKLSLLQS